MNREKQNILIALFCGWTQDKNGFWFKPGKRHSWNYDSYEPFPIDYLNDLNAIHEAEKYLSDTQIIDYQGQLAMICSTAFVRASAEKRVEAFLKAIKQWEE